MVLLGLGQWSSCLPLPCNDETNQRCQKRKWILPRYQPHALGDSEDCKRFNFQPKWNNSNNKNDKHHIFHMFFICFPFQGSCFEGEVFSSSSTISCGESSAVGAELYSIQQTSLPTMQLCNHLVRATWSALITPPWELRSIQISFDISIPFMWITCHMSVFVVIYLMHP